MYCGVPINPVLYGQRMQLWVRLWDSKTCPLLQLAIDQKRVCRTLKNYTYISPRPQPASGPLATFIKLGSSGKVRDREASACGHSSWAAVWLWKQEDVLGASVSFDLIRVTFLNPGGCQPGLWKLPLVIPVGWQKSNLSHPSVAGRVVLPCPVDNCEPKLG